MRYIYIDEAGTSAKEPITIVVGIIVHADTQWKLAESKIVDVIRAVPSHFRPNFIFHAKTIWGSKKYHNKWNLTDRLRLLHSMMQIPRQLNIPIALGILRRDAPQINISAPISKEEFQHMIAFGMCLSQADKYIRKYADPNEVATVVAEDVPKIRRFLRLTLQILRKNPIILTLDELRLTKVERSSGIITQDPKLMVSRVIDTIHFVEKINGPLLQIADACAFGFRRYFSGQKYGNDFVKSILGTELNIDDYMGLSSANIFQWVR